MKNWLQKFRQKRIQIALGFLVFVAGPLSFMFVQADFVSDSPPAGSKFIGAGGNSNVYQKGSYVYKIVRGGADTRNQMLDLHNDLAKEFPGIVSRLDPVGNNTLLQAFADGYHIEDLPSTAAQTKAKAEVAKLVERANRIAGQAWVGDPMAVNETRMFANGNVALIDPNDANFRFNADGSIKSWFDPIWIADASNREVVSFPPMSSTPPQPAPLAQRPGAVTSISVAGVVSLAIGLPLGVGDFILGYNSATDKKLYTGKYLVGTATGLAGYKAAEFMGATALRYAAGAAIAGVVGPWIGAGAMIGMTGYGIWHFGSELSSYIAQSPNFTSAGSSGLSRPNLLKVAQIANLTNGCVGTCNLDLNARHANYVATGVEIQELQTIYSQLTASQKTYLDKNTQVFLANVETHVSQIQAERAAGKTVPGTTTLQRIATNVANFTKVGAPTVVGSKTGGVGQVTPPKVTTVVSGGQSVTVNPPPNAAGSVTVSDMVNSGTGEVLAEGGTYYYDSNGQYITPEATYSNGSNGLGDWGFGNGIEAGGFGGFEGTFDIGFGGGFGGSPAGGGGGGGAGSCFVAGTAITLASGQKKNIEEIRIDDQVLTYDEDQNRYLSSRVTAIHHHPAENRRLFTITLADGSKLTAQCRGSAGWRHDGNRHSSDFRGSSFEISEG